ncbi:monovalent cation:proton antiporter-2 (CPA2) family protein [Aquamicrobium sp. LC103]|uniref:monovalent cation:proton antiporter-2 (CPA2) family protein n=1 Tax=Aquamicrobium sp. LC103 TaxID=1120658 RepID=UPI00063E8E4C|nr:monovalent cation:proton antiporter-2 (CPA2) family protein [Aquamicrobium sp. LC103]TKT69197.1 potassium transporter TrkA [Aquamicrobium sp. LC103]
MEERLIGVESSTFYIHALLLLGGAVVAAPIFKKAGLGTILGYLVAGIAMGPVARLITGGEDILNLGEFGVVLLLFIIGLELKPSRLWAMRRAIFGLGAAQVLVTGTVLSLLVVLLTEFALDASLVIGFGLALSSTAFAMQCLEDEGAVNRKHGQMAFSILLLQDLAIAPFLAILPLLSPGGHGVHSVSGAQFLVSLSCIAFLLVAGRYLLNPLFRVIANTGAKEAMIAAALFVVLGSALLMQAAGLSMALGAFVAGVMLAESSFRHELEANIEPFRGILLALFFMAVGLSLDIAVIREHWVSILAVVPLLMGIKAVLAYALCRLHGAAHDDAVRVALVLPQGGEFAFVLFSVAASAAIFSASTASLLIAIVTVTMALTPISVRLAPLFVRGEEPDEIEETFDGAGSDILMIGFSRFGQIASQVLLSGGSEVTVIDHSAKRVRAVEKFGFRIYFGDGRRKDVLEAAGIRRAKIVAVCTRGREMTDQIVSLIQSEFPDVKLFVRSYDRNHSLSLRAHDVEYEIRETLESALTFGRRTLEETGIAAEQAEEIADDVRERDEERLALQASGKLNTDGRHPGFAPATPEPLSKPLREGRRLDKKLAEEEGGNAA